MLDKNLILLNSDQKEKKKYKLTRPPLVNCFGDSLKDTGWSDCAVPSQHSNRCDATIEKE